MIPKFKFRLLSKSKILNNTSASIVFIFSFLLIFFTKTDYYLIDRIKSVSNEIINPVTKIVSLPVTASFNVINQTQRRDEERSISEENGSRV